MGVFLASRCGSLLRRVALILVSLCVLAAVAAAQEPDRYIVLNRLVGVDERGDPVGGTADVLGNSITETLELSLRLALDARIDRADFIYPREAPGRARDYYRQVAAGQAIYGTVARDPEGGYLITAYRWRRDEPDVPEATSYRLENVLAAFDVADSIALEIASDVAGRELAFGSVRLENVEWLDDFAVYADGNLLGRNRSRVRVVAGAREIVVARPGALGDEPVQVFSLEVPPDGEVRASLDTPDQSDAPEAAPEGPPAAVTQRDQEGAEPERTGRLRVETTPPGAEVLLDERVIGTTPLDRLGVVEGRYELLLRRPLFRPVVRVVDVPADETYELSVDLEVHETAPEIAELLVDPGAASIWSLGMTAVQVGAGLVNPSFFGGRGLRGAAGADFVLKTAVLRPGHWYGGRTREAAILSGVTTLSAGLLGWGGQRVEHIAEPGSALQRAAGSGQYVGVSLTTIGALYDLAVAPGAARRRNAALIAEIDRSGALPSRELREPGGFSLEAGGASIFRGGYTFRLLRHYLYGHASVGAVLRGVSPYLVAPGLLVRLDVFPMGPRTGHVRPYVGPALALDWDFSTIGLAAGYDYGFALLLRRLSVTIGSRGLWGLRSGLPGTYFFLGVQI